MATVFYEASTRTRISFETAVRRVGGHVSSIEDAGKSSVKKGESVQDTVRVLSGFADGIIICHPKAGSAQLAAKHASVPVINAGDGGQEHPTQALLDVYTIQREKGRVDGLSIGIVGDIEHSRTLQSVARLLSVFDVRMWLITPSRIQVPASLKQFLNQYHTSFSKTSDLAKTLPELDVVYINRIQKERYVNKQKLKVVRNFRLTASLMKGAKPDAIVMNPLPRVEEIAPEVDKDPRAAYFRQSTNGLYVRMALLKLIYS